MQHGTRSAYRKGCRCDECKAASAAYARQRRAADPEKSRANGRRYRDANPDKERERRRKWLAANPTYFSDQHASRRAECVELLGGVCVKCGTTESLEFDHVDPSTKAFEIGSRVTASWGYLLPELRKCQLLCQPCHVAKGEHGRMSKSA